MSETIQTAEGAIGPPEGLPDEAPFCPPIESDTPAALPVRRRGRPKNPNSPPRSSPTGHEVGTVVKKALADALDISPQDVASYLPTDNDMSVGEALIAGNSTIQGIQGYCGLAPKTIRETLDNPVAMSWISLRVEALFRSRASIVDAAVYLRAAQGDVQACKLFYERMRLLDSKTVHVNHHVTGGIDVRAVPDDELARMVREKTRMLPSEFKVIDVTPETEASGPQGS